MRSGWIGYFGDFVAYPVAIILLTSTALAGGELQSGVTYAGICAGALGLWTLVEYAIHRFMMHHAPMIQPLHERHHGDQRALIGTPFWLSMAIIFTVVFLPLYWTTDFLVASAATTGILLGYLWFVTVHHIVHHWSLPHGTYMYRAKRRHALHHSVAPGANFGVTSSFWDRVFGTAVGRRRGHAIRSVS